MIGQTISHYRILEKLGEGGMGVVYKAQDLMLSRFVALKFLPDQVSTIPEDTARFLQEARAAAALNHPNICTIYGIEESEGTHCIAMEFVDGQTLQEKKYSLPVKRAVEIGIQIAEGLAAAHDQGIVHRDIKPENIMVRRDGSVVIMDFGLAKLRGASRITKASSTVGTAGYMSPEQIQGQDVDHRSDIFALGVMLYELVAGEPPFKGVHETALTYEIVNVDPKPISSFRDDVPPELDAIILECLEKEKSERYQSAKEIAKDLRKFTRSTEGRRSRTIQNSALRPMADTVPGAILVAEQRSHEQPRLRRVPVKKVAVVAALLGLPVLSAILAWMLHPQQENIVRKFQWPSEYAYTVISPDGRKVAYARGNTLWIRSFDRLDPVEIRDANTIAPILWAPGSESVAYFTNDGNNPHELRRASLAGAGNTLIARTPLNSYPRFWGLDDSILVSSWDARGLNFLWKVAATGGELKPVAGGDSALFTIRDDLTDVAPLTDGSSFLLSIRAAGGRGWIFAQNDRRRSIIFDGPADIFMGNRVAYDRAGFILFAFGAIGSPLDLWALPFDATSLKATGDRFLVARNADHVSISRTGMLLYTQGADPYASGGDQHFILLSRSGQLLKTLPGLQSEIFSPAVSPDGSFIAASAGVLGKTFDLWLTDLRREAQFRLSYDIKEVYHPRWSPDGRRIVYQSGFFDSSAIYVQSTDGLSAPQLLVSDSDGVGGSEPCWSSDGRYIVYTRGRPRQYPKSHIWFIEMGRDATSRQVTDSPFNEYQPCLSPDGRFLAFTSDKSGRQEVYVTEFPKAVRLRQVSFEGAAFPQWVGNEIFYVTDSEARLMSVRVDIKKDLLLETPRRLFSGDSLGVNLRWGAAMKYYVLPDSKSILTTRSARKVVASSHLILVENWIEEFRRNR